MTNLTKKITIFILIAVILSPFVFSVFLENIYAQKIYPHIKIAGLNIGGLRFLSAEKLIKTKIEETFGGKIIFVSKDKKWEADFQKIGVFISPEENTFLAYQIAHRKNIFLNFKEQIKVFFGGGYNLKISYFLSEEKLNEYLSREITAIENPPVNASLIFFINEVGGKDFKLKPAQSGLVIDKKALKRDINFKVSNLLANPIKLKFVKGYPEVKNNEIEEARQRALKIINRSLKLKYQDKTWEIEPERIASWLSFIPVRESKKSSNKILGVDVNQEKIKEYLESLVPQINQEPVNAELTIKDGRVAVFALSHNGLELSINENLKKISRALLDLDKPHAAEVVLEVKVVKPEITIESIENLGITSLIGQGTSNFAGSPRNRRHNIKVGAAVFHGVLIKPGEEFSFNKMIGKIGPQKGYLPELIIRHNRTVPEYGGGLCQVSTTCFRAALYAGLPITERQAHAYAVRYYNPQGMDATIYPPHPDLRFVNDTPNYILIQTKIEGNVLTFNFYGTDDGREIKIKGPYIYDRKKNGAMKAVVHREIYRGEELVKKESFYSFYNSPSLYPRRSPLE